MGRNIPRLMTEQITWFQTHVPGWESAGGGTLIGLTPAQVQAVKAATELAAEAQQRLVAAREAARSAFIARQEAVEAMNRLGRSAVNTIKAFLEAGDGESLWGLAGIAPDQIGGPGRGEGSRRSDGGLTAPYALASELLPTGEVQLRWKARQPASASGVVYRVLRSIDEGPFMLLDVVGGKVFIDETVPTGARSVGYILRAARGRSQSAPSAEHTVRFGVAAAGSPREPASGPRQAAA